MNPITKYSILSLSALSSFCTGAHYTLKAGNFIESTCIQYLSSIERMLEAPILSYTGLKRDTPIKRMYLSDIIEAKAKSAGIKPELIDALITVESNWKSDAIGINNPAHPMETGDFGLTQVNFQWINTKLCGAKSWHDLLDAQTNIDCGVNILAEAIKTSKSISDALSKYNTGNSSSSKGIEYARKISSALVERMRD